MLKFTLALVIFSCCSIFAYSDGDIENLGFSFKGFVKTDMFYDTRQNIVFREGHFLLYPKSKSLDPNGEDINATGSFNILSIQTRLTGVITGPKVLGAKSSGLIEMAFFGASNDNINTLRLRHAFLKLDWEKTQLLFGQYWHPLFSTSCFPDVVSFNTGAPFEPFSRNPQIRLTQSISSDSKILVAFLSQRDFQSLGPDGASSKYQSNALIPEAYLGIEFNPAGNSFGLGAEYKILKPRLATDKSIKAENKIGSYSAHAFAKFNADQFTFKIYGIYGQNLTNMLMLGGYAVKSYDAASGNEEYTPYNTISAWTELTYGTDIQAGIFAGYTKNLGTDYDILDIEKIYSRDPNIASIYRVSPKIQWTINKVRFALELEYTQAKYGTINITKKGEVENTYSVNNLRTLFAAYLFF